MKEFLGIAAFLMASAGPAFATDYVYDISNSFGPFLSGGEIVTTCDQCVLSSANVVSWSMYVDYKAIGLPPAGSPFTSSSLPNSSVQVLGTGLTATPTGVFFNFNVTHATATDIVSFASGNNSVQLQNFPESPGAGLTGAFNDCIAGGGGNSCAGETPDSNMELGSFSKLEAPELGASRLASALTLLLSGLAIWRGKLREGRIGRNALFIPPQSSGFPSD